MPRSQRRRSLKGELISAAAAEAVEPASSPRTSAQYPAPVVAKADGDDQRHHRIDRLQQPLTAELHSPVVDPQWGLERARDENHQQHQAGRDHLGHAIEKGEERQGGRQHQDEQSREQELEREGLLKRHLLVLLVLLDVLVADPDLLQPDERAEGHRQQPPDPIVGAGQKPGQDEVLDQAQGTQEHQERGVDERTTGDVLPKGALDIEAPRDGVSMIDRGLEV